MEGGGGLCNIQFAASPHRVYGRGDTPADCNINADAPLPPTELYPLVTKNVPYCRVPTMSYGGVDWKGKNSSVRASFRAC